MARWLIKSAVQRAISWLPHSQKWNEWLQRRSNSLALNPGVFEAKLDYSRQYYEDFAKILPERSRDFTAFELGTGWYPTVPIALFLCGAKEIWSYDIDPLLRSDRIRTLLEFFCDYDRQGRLQTFLPGVLAERLKVLQEALPFAANESPEKFLNRFNIHFLVQDARSSGLPPDSVDLFFSHSVMEYIPAPIMEGIFREFCRVTRGDAVMIHYITLFDQFARFDRSIMELNYLKFTSAQWKRLRSPLIPSTRMRINEHHAQINGGGFRIVREALTRAPLEALTSIKLAPEFQNFPPDDLRVITAWIVAQKN